ncbi:MAG: CHC2 zinc finger domain-containing protein [Candidatus Thiodiazotropha endolucinida]
MNDILTRFDNVRLMGEGKYMCHCPAHDDRSPSLSIKLTGDRILFHCFAGCDTESVLDAVGLSFRDLFSDESRAAYAAATACKGNKLHLPIDPVEQDRMVLRLARSDLKAGKEHSLEDRARIELAKDRLRERAQ